MAQHTSEIRYGGCNAFEEELVLRLYAVYLVDIPMLHPIPEANPPMNPPHLPPGKLYARPGYPLKNRWFSRMAHRVSVFTAVSSYSFKEKIVLRFCAVYFVDISQCYIPHTTPHFSKIRPEVSKQCI